MGVSLSATDDVHLVLPGLQELSCHIIEVHQQIRQQPRIRISRDLDDDRPWILRCESCPISLWAVFRWGWQLLSIGLPLKRWGRGDLSSVLGACLAFPALVSASGTRRVQPLMALPGKPALHRSGHSKSSFCSVLFRSKPHSCSARIFGKSG